MAGGGGLGAAAWQEVAVYDVLATRGEAWVEDPRLKEIAVEITRPDDPALGIDWTERANLEAKVRLRIKQVLRRRKAMIPVEGGDLDALADRVFEQARLLYERWPEVEGEPWH